MDGNNTTSNFSKTKHNSNAKQSPLEETFGFIVFIMLSFLSVIIAVASLEIGVFTLLKTKSTFAILSFRFIFAVAVPCGLTGLLCLLIRYLTRPSALRRYILEGIACRLKYVAGKVAGKTIDFLNDNVSPAIDKWLEKRKEKKCRRLGTWKEWSEWRNDPYQDNNYLPVSLFLENDED